MNKQRLRIIGGIMNICNKEGINSFAVEDNWSEIIIRIPFIDEPKEVKE